MGFETIIMIKNVIATNRISKNVFSYPCFIRENPWLSF